RVVGRLLPGRLLVMLDPHAALEPEREVLADHVPDTNADVRAPGGVRDSAVASDAGELRPGGEEGARRRVQVDRIRQSGERRQILHARREATSGTDAEPDVVVEVVAQAHRRGGHEALEGAAALGEPPTGKSACEVTVEIHGADTRADLPATLALSRLGLRHRQRR